MAVIGNLRVVFDQCLAVDDAVASYDRAGVDHSAVEDNGSSSERSMPRHIRSRRYDRGQSEPTALENIEQTDPGLRSLDLSHRHEPIRTVAQPFRNVHIGPDHGVSKHGGADFVRK